MGENSLGSIIIILILVCINAFFAASEMAIVSLNKNKINMLVAEGNKKAEALIKLLDEPSNFLATIQVGITLAGFFASASAATGISNNFATKLSYYNIPYSQQIALILTTIVISYLTLVLGELLPKRIALQKSEVVAMFSIKIIVFLSKVAKPFVKFLSASTNLLIRILGISTEGLEEKVTEEEIKSLINIGEEHGVINKTERDMLDGIFEFDDKVAREIMTPRTEVYMINAEDSFRELIDELINEKFSRIPIYEEDIDNIIGVLNIKDILTHLSKGDIESTDIRSIIKPGYFVPENKNIDELFKELKTSKNHMAILIDEYGGFSGVVTIEDIIEEVMGDISDEYDEEENFIIKLDSSTYSIDGKCSLEDINEELHIEIVSQYAETIGGFMLEKLGNIPKETDNTLIEYDNLLINVDTLGDKRIERVKLAIQKKEKIND
ncbi:hemolysin family protein [Clostridium intestinale]|uniref:HlyC/CorC family transporter n=1 Tax=Clostridium intestinale TaxID=36845 RepID=A0A7D6ZX23_9CLOT|nr:hemolysin family protein [Clostridium intestinale]QLY79382.1 HlyC/CorC family transporter [Clostridium intestinale]